MKRGIKLEMCIFTAGFDVSIFVIQILMVMYIPYTHLMAKLFLEKMDLHFKSKTYKVGH